LLALLRREDLANGFQLGLEKFAAVVRQLLVLFLVVVVGVEDLLTLLLGEAQLVRRSVEPVGDRLSGSGAEQPLLKVLARFLALFGRQHLGHRLELRVDKLAAGATMLAIAID